MEKSIPIAVAAAFISVVAVASSIVLRPATLAPEVTTDELADGAVTSDKILEFLENINFVNAVNAP